MGRERGGGSGAAVVAARPLAATGAALLAAAILVAGGAAVPRSAVAGSVATEAGEDGSSGARAAVDPPAACAVLEIRSVPDGGTLDRIPVPDGRFALSFRHSVTLRPVVDRYVVDPGGAIRQTAEEFDQHGPGLPASAEPGRPWQRRGDVWIVPLDRPIDRLVVRVDPAAENRLYAGPAPAAETRLHAGAGTGMGLPSGSPGPAAESLPSTGAASDLTRWGRRAVEIVPTACDRPDPSR